MSGVEYVDEAVSELVKLAELLSDRGIRISCALRYLRTLLMNERPVLSELMILQEAEKVFGKKFHKMSGTPDLVSEDGLITIEAKSFEEGDADVERIVKLWFLPNKEKRGDKHKLRQLGVLSLLKDKGVEVYVAIHVRATGEIKFIHLDKLLEYIPQDVVIHAKRYALNTKTGRPPKITDEEVERYARRYPTLSISALTAVINADRQRRGLPPVSTWAISVRLRKLGYVRKVVKGE